MLNKVMLIGRLGTDPEMRFTANGSPVASFRLAVGRTYTGADGERKEETEWFTVVSWNKLAELVNQYFTKGRLAYVEGRLQTRSWEGQDGQRHYRTEVIANTARLLDRPASAGAPLREEGSDDLDADDLPF